MAKKPIKYDPKEVNRRSPIVSDAEQKIHDRSLRRTQGSTHAGGRATGANVTPNNARRSLNQGLRRDRADILRTRRSELARAAESAAAKTAGRKAAVRVGARILAGVAGGVAGAAMTVGDVANSMDSARRQSQKTTRSRNSASGSRRRGGSSPRG